MTVDREPLADMTECQSVFVMVAGPSSIGKSTCIRDLRQRWHAEVVGLHDDELLARMMRRLRLDRYAGCLNRDREWRREAERTSIVEEVVALHHLEWCCAARTQSRVVLAEGYMYMRAWYRDAVYAGHRLLPWKTTHVLVHFFPQKSAQVGRRRARPRCVGMSDRDVWAQVALQHSRFQLPSATEDVRYAGRRDEVSMERLMTGLIGAGWSRESD